MHRHESRVGVIADLQYIVPMEKETPETFFRVNLRFLRKKAGQSQEGLAAILGWKRSLVAAYESGLSETNHLRLLQLAQYFGLGLDALILGDLRVNKIEKTAVQTLALKDIQDSHESTKLALEGIQAMIDLAHEEEGSAQNLGYQETKQLLWLAQKLLSLNADLLQLLKEGPPSST